MPLPPVSRVHPRSCCTCSLHQSFCHLPQRLREAFDDIKTTVVYGKGERVFHERDRCHSVFAVCEGGVKLVTSSREGRTLLLRFAQPGEILALADAVLGRTRYACSAICAEPSILAVIPRETFIRFISSYPEACVALTVTLSEQYKFAQRQTKFLGMGDSSKVRLAHVLLEWSSERGTRAADGATVLLHVTHVDLAQAIGATRETVTRILSHLTHSGIVERRWDGIVIRHPDQLTLLASPAITKGCDEVPFREEEPDVSIPEELLAFGGVS